MGVQYCQITKPCLCGKWQIWVAKVKKNVFYHPKKWRGGWAPQPHPLRGPWKNQSKRHYPASHHIFSTKATKCNEIVNVQFIHSSLESQQHECTCKLTCYKMQFSKLRNTRPCYLDFKFKKITTICNALQHKQFQSELFANNNKENIGSQKLRNYWVAMSSYILCKARSFSKKISSKLFGIPGWKFRR